MSRPDLVPPPPDPPSIPSALRASIGFLLSRVGGESRRRFVQTLAAWDLKPAHYGVLMVLAEVGAASQQRLGAIVGIDPRNLVAVIDVLEGRSLVSRGPDPADRRRHAVRLTATGRASLDEMRAASDEIEREMLAVLGDAEQAVLHELLSRLLPTVERAGK